MVQNIVSIFSCCVSRTPICHVITNIFVIISHIVKIFHSVTMTIFRQSLLGIFTCLAGHLSLINCCLNGAAFTLQPVNKLYIWRFLRKHISKCHCESPFSGRKCQSGPILHSKFQSMLFCLRMREGWLWTVSPYQWMNLACCIYLATKLLPFVESEGN